jgi:hypothetical protein
MAILTCGFCGKVFEGRANAGFCSAAHKKAAQRANRDTATGTEPGTVPVSTKTGVPVNPITELAFETGLTILGGGIKADESHLHEGHDVHPHAHPRPAPDAELFVAHCSGRWFCMTCRSEKSPTGTWFTGKVCVA